MIPLRSTQAVAKPRAVFKIRAKVWVYQGFGGWYFVRLTVKRSAMIGAL